MAAPDPRWGLGSWDLARFKQLDPSKVRFLWLHDYYDGPLSGALLYGGRLHWFEYCGETASARRYVVFELTDAQIEDETRWQRLFEQHVGDHWTARDDRPGTVRPLEEHAKFYGPYAEREPVDYSHNPVVGWIEDR